MIIVTGGAGFIGSNIVKGLNERGRDDILIVDNLTNMVKFKNIQGLKALDYMDKIDFAEALKAGKFNSTMKKLTLFSTRAHAATPWNTTANT